MDFLHNLYDIRISKYTTGLGNNLNGIQER